MSNASGGLQVTQFLVSGMDCADEVAVLKQTFQERDGVEELSFNLMRATMKVTHVPSIIDANEIVRLVHTTGMTATLAEQQADRRQFQATVPRGPLLVTVLAATGTVLGLGLTAIPAAAIHHTTWPSAVAYLVAIGAAWRYVGPKAWYALKRARLDMNVLMTVAVLGAVALGEWFEASIVAFLFMVSHLLETWSVARARQAIHSLMELSPPRARVQAPDGTEHEIETDQVAVGSRIVVRPGEKFPLDGRVVEGETAADQSPITGEAAPVPKSVGDEVFAGTINQDGAVVVNVTKPLSDTVLACVIRLVEQAQSRRSRSEQFVERFAYYYTPAVVLGAVLTCVIPPVAFGAMWNTWFYRSLVLLVIACPCALVISTPITIVSALAAAARNGILIKGGEFLEAVGRTEVLALDKTGTLTLGKPAVERIIPIDRMPENRVLKLAAAIEQRSEHPMAAAIVQCAERRGIKPPASQDHLAIRGKGAQAVVEGEVYLLGNHRLLEEYGVCTEQVHRTMLEHEDCHHIAVGLASTDEPLGVILLSDGLRPEAKDVIARLRRSGVRKIVMLTGDNAGTAEAIAQECGGIEYQAELLPADKVSAVRQLRDSYGRIAMIGDGVNDAPALATADVGIAMGAGGTDAALETADIALMTDDLGKLPWLLCHSRRAKATIVQNITLSLSIKALFLVLAIKGLANLWMAIAADMGTSLLVIFNGLRLLGHGRRTG